MDREIESNISKNIKELRLQRGMKQRDLGKKISYSDKTVSKWENGTSSPDINALAAISELFGVTIDDLIKPNAVLKAEGNSLEQRKEDKKNDIAMLALSILSVVTVCVILYVALYIIKNQKYWQAFVWAVPPSMLFAYRYNKTHENVRWANAVLLSIFCWSLLAAVYLQFIDYNIWPLFFLGAPVQPMIIISTLFKKKQSKIVSIRL